VKQIKVTAVLATVEVNTWQHDMVLEVPDDVEINDDLALHVAIHGQGTELPGGGRVVSYNLKQLNGETLEETVEEVKIDECLTQST